MNTERRQIVVDGLSVHIVRKAIKNLHLGVYPPNGRVRVAAPLAVSDHAVRLAVVGKLGWIKRQRARFEDQSRQSRRELVSGETHYFLGRRYRLRVVSHSAAARVVVRGNSVIELHVRPGSSTEHRERALQEWHRLTLQQRVPPLLHKWQRTLGVQVEDWRIRKMKTKWGSCNARAARIWLNLELAKKPARCLEYLVVHELAHLIERHHNDRFTAIMDRYLPQWRSCRAELNAFPLQHESWTY